MPVYAYSCLRARVFEWNLDRAASIAQKPGRASFQHVGHALRELHKFVESEGVHSLALPRIATGVGGLDWKDVQPLLVQHLGSLQIPVYVYVTYAAGQHGKETELAAA
jgi:O-acetyl-ADP-ribose deacetylase (regulator of RNase III)